MSTDIRLVENLIVEAEKLINQDKLTDAQKILIEILETHDPENLDAANNLAVTEILLGNFSSAENLLKQILEKFPGNETALANLNTVYNFIYNKECESNKTSFPTSNNPDYSSHSNQINERSIMPYPSLICYQGEIYDEVYPHFRITRLLKELRNIIHEICYVCVWNSYPEKILEWKNQKLPMKRFNWLLQNTAIFAPITHQMLEKINQDSKNDLSLYESANIIITAINEVRNTVIKCSESIEVTEIECKNSFDKWYTELNSRPEKWLIDEFITEIKNNKPEGLEAVLLHGSLSDGLTEIGYSDFDVNYVIAIPDKPEKLIELLEWILKSNRYLLSYNPFMHHGPILVLKEELLVCSESVFPGTLISNGVWLHGRINEIRYISQNFEDINSILSFKDFFTNNFRNIDEFKNIFDIIWWSSSVLMIPLLYNQMLTGKSIWKRDLITNKHNIPEQYHHLIEIISELRNKISDYLKNKLELPLPLINKDINPGIILKRNKENLILSPEEIAALGINNELVSQAREYFEYCLKAAYTLNESNLKEYGFSHLELNTHWLNEVCEIPERTEFSDYNEVREEFLRRCSLNNKVISVYEFGNIGCPGLSDLDFLVILSEDCNNIPQELKIENMSPKHAAIMNHNPLFVGESSVDFLGAVFPLFNAQLVYGSPVKLKMSSEFSETVQLSLFTFINVLKYPNDILYLARQEKIRWKTLLAYLNSFNHIIRALESLKIDVPQSVKNCIDLNRHIRSKFNMGKIELKDLNSAVGIMIEASADMILEFEKLWARYLPELKEIYQLSDRNEFLKNIHNTFSTKGKEKFELTDIVKIVMLHLQKTDDCISIHSELFEKFSELFDEYLRLKNIFISSELKKGRSADYYITGQEFSTNLSKDSLGNLSLARLDQIESSQFKWFMFKLNLFAYENSLRPMINWSKVWEYPWIWFNIFQISDLKGKVVVDLGSELSPVPWVLALNGAKVILIETESKFIPVWEKTNNKLKLNVEWKIVNDEIIPLPDNYADYITSFSVIEHQPDKFKAIDEVIRVLKNNGVFGLSFDICEESMGMTFPEWNGKALTMDDFDRIIWRNSAFNNCNLPYWNITDIEKFWAWHLKSAEHHNYVTGAAILKNHKMQQIDCENYVIRDGNNKPTIKISSETPLILNKSEIKTIIWLRTDSIGDNILASSMLKYIKSHLPGADITVVCQNQITELYEYCPYISGVIGFDKSRMIDDSGYRESIFKDINSLNPDLLLNTVYSSEKLTHDFTQFSEAKLKIGISGDTSNISTHDHDEAESYYTHLIVTKPGVEVEIIRHEEILKALNIKFSELKPEIWLSDDDLKWVNQKFQEYNTENAIALFAGTQHSIKNYKSLGKAINEIQEKNSYTFFILGDGNNEAINKENINDIDARIVNLTGNTSIRQAMALISKCKLAVGVDTSLAHAACAFDVPNVIVLGGGHFGRFLPYSGKTSIVCKPMSCFGCSWDCIYDRAQCITDIDHHILTTVIMQALKSSYHKPMIYFSDTTPMKSAVSILKSTIDQSKVKLISINHSGTITEYFPPPKDEQNILYETKIKSNYKLNSKEKITVITTIAPFDIEKQKLAIESWLNAGLNVLSLNCSQEKEILEPLFPHVRFIEADRDAKSIAGKPYVYFDDILENLGKSGSQICGIINSDILLNVTTEFISEIKSYASDSLVYGCRVDVEKPDSFAGSFYEFGYDFFFFDKSLIQIYPESDFCLGLPWWDYWMVAVPLSKKIKLTKVISPVAFHLWHPTKYNNEYWLNLGKSFIDLLENQHLIKINKDSYIPSNTEETNSLISYELFVELNKYATKTEVSCVSRSILLHPKDFVEKSLKPKQFFTLFYHDANPFKPDGSKSEIQFAEEIESLVDKGLFEEAFIKIWEYLRINQNCLLAIHYAIIFCYMKNDFHRAAYFIKNLLKKEIKDYTSLNILQYFKSNFNQSEESTKEIKVSAIVSVYNSGKYIKGCLEDLTSQTLFKKGQLEIVIVNCGSDKTDEEEVVKFKSQFPNIVYIKIDERISIYKAWNIAIKAASGKFITNANTDDRHKSDALENMLNIFKENHKVDVVYANCFQTEKPNAGFDSSVNNKLIKWADFDKDLLLFGCFIGPQPMWKKSLHNKYGYFDESLEVVGDYEFWLRVSESANFHHIDEALGLYYFSSSSAEHRNKELTELENKQVQTKYISQYIKSHSDIERVAKKALIISEGNSEAGYYKLVCSLLEPRIKEIENEIQSNNLTGDSFNILLRELNVLIESGKFDESINKALLYLEEVETETDECNTQNLQSLFNLLGNLYLHKNDIENAHRYFAEELKLNPESSRACYGLAQTFFAGEMYNEAKTMFEWAVHHNSDNAEAVNGLIKVNELLGLESDNYSLVSNL